MRDLGVDGWIIIKCTLKEVKVWTGFNWSWTKASDGLLWTRQGPSGYHKNRGI